MDSIIRFFEEFWRQAVSVLSDLAEWLVSVIDPNAGAWPKIVVGGILLLILLLVVSRTSRPR